MNNKKIKAIKAAIVVVAILLALSIIALGWTIFYNKILLSKPSSVRVPDNYIKNRVTSQIDTSDSLSETNLNDTDARLAEETEENDAGMQAEFVSDTAADTKDLAEADIPTVIGTEALISAAVETEKATFAETDETYNVETDADTADIGENALVTETEPETAVESAKDTETQSISDGESIPGGDGYKALRTVTSGTSKKKLVPDRRSSDSTDSDSDFEAVYARLFDLSINDPDVNMRFDLPNMFPGDSETRYYCARVKFTDSAKVYFQATVREGYEKLAEVLKIKVEQLNEGKVLYEGLMSDMPAVSETTVYGSGKSKYDVFYAITVSLDTSVGNEYMEKELVADFRWWSEYSDEFGDHVPTGGGGPVIRPSVTTKPGNTDSDDITEPEDTSDSSDDVTDSVGDITDSEDITSDSDNIGSESGTYSEEETRSEDSAVADTTTESGKKNDKDSDNDNWNEHASQTSDETIMRMQIAAYAALSALLLLILLLLIRLKDDEYGKNKQH